MGMVDVVVVEFVLVNLVRLVESIISHPRAEMK